MLNLLELSLDAPIPDNDAAVTRQQTIHEMTFGAKTSLAATLVTLAELLLSLEQPEKTPDADNAAARSLSSSDIALVEAFVRKIKNNSAVPLKGELFAE